MTRPATTPAVFQPSRFLDLIVLFLTPNFLGVTSDSQLSRAEILETLASYGARTRSQLIQAVQIVALSFSSLEFLAEAKATPEMPAPLRLRLRGCANALNRSAQQVEKVLANA